MGLKEKLKEFSQKSDHSALLFLALVPLMLPVFTIIISWPLRLVVMFVFAPLGLITSARGAEFLVYSSYGLSLLGAILVIIWLWRTIRN